MGKKKHQQRALPSQTDTGPERFPAQLLSQSEAARQAHFERCLIEHTHLCEAVTAVQYAICMPGQDASYRRAACMVLVIGPSRVGKTTLIHLLEEDLMLRAKPRMQEDPAYIPLVSIITDGSGRGRFEQTYLGMLFPVMGFFLEKGYAWNDPPERVRTYLVEFLRDRLACRMQPDQDREGYWIEPSRTSPLSKSGLGVLLAALKDCYRLMRDAGYYAYPSPMASHLLEQWQRERARLIAAAGAPDHAGIRSESWEESRRHPVAYFRQGKRKHWQPKIALESAEVRERMWDALIYMTHHAPTQPGKVVLLLLRHTGARLHEILGMTVGGYRKAADPLHAFVVNKGSLGREEKLITFLDTDEEELLKYLRGERAQYDPLGRTQLVDLDDPDPLFLTARRKPYADAAFRYHWNCLMEQVQPRYRLAFTPHTVRHLFVTQHLVRIREEAGDDREEQQRLKAGLVQIMGWHSRETMRIYDHTFSVQEAVQKLHDFQKQAERRACVAAAQEQSSQHMLRPSGDDITIIEDVEPLNAFAQLWEELA